MNLLVSLLLATGMLVTLMRGWSHLVHEMVEVFSTLDPKGYQNHLCATDWHSAALGASVGEESCFLPRLDHASGTSAARDLLPFLHQRMEQQGGASWCP